MKLALLQMKIAFEEPLKNREKAAEMIKEAAESGADTIVLPETWNLGFFPKDDLEAQAEPEHGSSFQLLSKLAEKYSVNIVGGSLITKKGDGVYNTAYILDRQGRQIGEYDKIHSFSPSGEDSYFRPGKKIEVFCLDGVKAGIVLCYDVRFCELVRTLALEDIQILFVPAAWPRPRLEHWRLLNRARAIENQMYAACVNGCGTAGEMDFCGHSMAVGPFGEVLAEADDGETILYADADFGLIGEIRNSINVFRDRKPELYHIG